MGKIIFWLIVVFAILFVLRLVNTNKARRRANDANKPRNATDAGAMVRCVRCGVFLPRVDALPSPSGFTCGEASCASKGH